MATHVRFFFDFMSPYCYITYVNLQRLLKEYAGQLTVSYHPCSYNQLHTAWGTKSQAKVPPKSAFSIKDVYRTTKNRNMPFSVPKKYPFSSEPLLALSLASVGGADQPKIIGAIWSAIWGNPKGEGLDLSDENELKKLLKGLDLEADELLAYSRTEAKREELAELSHNAAKLFGVFGVPTMVLTNSNHGEEDPELYFGSDQILAVRILLDGGSDYMRNAPEPLKRFLKGLPSAASVVPDRPKHEIPPNSTNSSYTPPKKAKL